MIGVLQRHGAYIGIMAVICNAMFLRTSHVLFVNKKNTKFTSGDFVYFLLREYYINGYMQVNNINKIIYQIHKWFNQNFYPQGLYEIEWLETAYKGKWSDNSKASLKDRFIIE